MKKVFILLLLLNMLLFATAWKSKQKEVPTPAILKEYPFTMTRKEIQKKHPGCSLSYFRYANYLCISKKIMGHDAKLYFSQAYKDKSVEKRTFRIFIEQKNNSRKPIYEYNNTRRLLTKKYGYPNSNKSEYKKGTSQQKIKIYNKKLDGKELAFNNADLTHISIWKKEKFTIELKCYKYNKYKKVFFIDLAYIAPKAKTAPPVKVASKAKKIDPLTEL